MAIRRSKTANDISLVATGSPVVMPPWTLDCCRLEFHEMGTHTVFYGLSRQLTSQPVDPNGAREVLVYHDRHASPEV